ncbi:hypothetical protein FDECE_2203 [Fusarium decemcellulare]|nr:hypothetical protein FDECE_2203 [Fusarium decemcellulare]
MFLEPYTSAQPPTLSIMPYTETLIFTLGSWVPYVAAVVYGISNWLINNDATCLLFVIGGSLCVIPEPLLDALVHCSFAPMNDLTFFYHRNTGIPWFMLASYGAYNGGMSYYWYRKFQDKENPMTRRGLWNLVAIAYLADFILEYPVNNIPLQDYWGYQPFKLLGMPWYLPAVNAVMPLVIASLVNILGDKNLKGWKKLAVVLIVPSGNVLGTSATAWPVWYALDLDTGPLVSETAAMVSFTLVAIAVWIMSLQFEKPADKAKIR